MVTYSPLHFLSNLECGPKQSREAPRLFGARQLEVRAMSHLRESPEMRSLVEDLHNGHQ